MGTIRFTPALIRGAPIGEIEGEEIGFGLVIHPYITDDGLATDGCMDISEPTTGCRVIGGWSMEEALQNLERLVQLRGGPDGFRQALRRGIETVRKHDQSRNEEAA